MDTQVFLTLLFSGIVCFIGVCTFIIGMTQRAKHDGMVEEKLSQCCKGIEDIKNDLKAYQEDLSTVKGMVLRHDEQLKRLIK